MYSSRKILKIGLILLVTTLLFVSVAYAKKADDLEGAAYSLDNDGSNRWLWISDYSGVYDLLWFDDMCSACTAPGLRPSCVIAGSGHLSSSDEIDIYGAELYCYWEGGAELWDRSLDPDAHIILLPSGLQLS